MKDLLDFAGEHPFVFIFSLAIVCCLASEIFQTLARLIK